MISKKIYIILFTILSSLWLYSGVAHDFDENDFMVIDCNTPWVISKDQPEPIQRAIEDLKRDWYKVIGFPPIIIDRIPENYSGPLIILGDGANKFINSEEELVGDVESFNIFIDKSQNGNNCLIASGIDLRGTIFALYSFSEYILNVDPWYYWTDNEPKFRGEINIPVDFKKVFMSPEFRFRGWFINDEDLLNGFSNDPLGENIFSLTMWDKIYETILRLRGNMIAPGTFTFPDEKAQILATKRGLFINQHHIMAVGLNTFQWPNNIQFSFSENPATMIEFWRKCIEAYRGQDIVWTVGYRGKHDRPFWMDENGADNDSIRGDIISRAIKTQVDLINQVQPNSPKITNLWMEGVDLYKKGYMKIPPEVTVVWPDNGSGIIRDQGLVKDGDGIYYHTAMRNFRTNQLTEMVSPDVILDNVGRFIDNGANEFLLVNVSDVRSYPLSTDYIMKLGWYGLHYKYSNITDYYSEFVHREYNLNSPTSLKLANLYKKYFNIPYVLNEGLGEDHLSRLIFNPNGFDLDYNKKENLEMWRKKVATYIEFTEKLYKDVLDFQDSIPAVRLEFYNAHLKSQTLIHLSLQKMLYHYLTGKTLLLDQTSEDISALNEYELAIKEYEDNFLGALRIGENDKWKGFYFNDIMSPHRNAYVKIKRDIQEITGKKHPLLDLIDYNELYNYQEKFQNNYPLMY